MRRSDGDGDGNDGSPVDLHAHHRAQIDQGRLQQPEEHRHDHHHTNHHRPRRKHATNHRSHRPRSEHYEHWGSRYVYARGQVRLYQCSVVRLRIANANLRAVHLCRNTSSRSIVVGRHGAIHAQVEQ